MSPIPINLALEDELTELLTLKVLRTIANEYATKTIYNRGGHGYLKKTINGFNNAAKGIPFIVATDLDDYACPPALINDWLTSPRHHNLLIGVAVRESEAWVLADRINFARFLGIDVIRVPQNVESLDHPKEELIRLARSSRRKELRDDICPSANSTSKIGPNYNACLGRFVSDIWNPATARQNSPSLDRAINRLEAFRPHWPAPAHACEQ